MNAAAFLRERVAIDKDGCWNWKLSKRPNGYGQLTFKGVVQSAHRWAFAMLVKKPGRGAWILHRCDNKACVNPAHLYEGTPADNRRDTLARSEWRHPWGLRDHCARGHDYETSGYRIASDGSRVCRRCQREYKRAYRAGALR